MYTNNNKKFEHDGMNKQSRFTSRTHERTDRETDEHDETIRVPCRTSEP